MSDYQTLMYLKVNCGELCETVGPRLCEFAHGAKDGQVAGSRNLRLVFSQIFVETASNHSGIFATSVTRRERRSMAMGRNLFHRLEEKRQPS